MAEDKIYEGIKVEDNWIARGKMTFTEAEEIIQQHMRGANLNSSYDLEDAGDHLQAIFIDNDQPRSSDSPGNNEFSKDDTWATPGKEKSRK